MWYVWLFLIIKERINYFEYRLLTVVRNDYKLCSMIDLCYEQCWHYPTIWYWLDLVHLLLMYVDMVCPDLMYVDMICLDMDLAPVSLSDENAPQWYNLSSDQPRGQTRVWLFVTDDVILTFEKKDCDTLLQLLHLFRKYMAYDYNEEIWSTTDKFDRKLKIWIFTR